MVFSYPFNTQRSLISKLIISCVVTRGGFGGKLKLHHKRKHPKRIFADAIWVSEAQKSQSEGANKCPGCLWVAEGANKKAPEKVPLILKTLNSELMGG